MVSKITLGLILSAAGLAVALLPTMLYLATLGTPMGDALGAEVLPSIPLYLMLSMVGVPPSIVGAVTFRKGVRELVASQVLSSRTGAAPQAGSGVQQARAATGVRTQQASSEPGVRVQQQATTGTGRVQPQSPQPRRELALRVRTRSDSKVCPSCGGSVEVAAEICPSCGFRFTIDRDSGCPVCGAPLSRLSRLSGDLFVCGICFSELERVTVPGTGQR